jgi:hypothetical protein
VAVGALLGAIVEVLDDDGLAAGVAALQEHHHLVGLEELHHGGAGERGRERAAREMAKENNGRAGRPSMNPPRTLNPNPNPPSLVPSQHPHSYNT